MASPAAVRKSSHDRPCCRYRRSGMAPAPYRTRSALGVEQLRREQLFDRHLPWRHPLLVDVARERAKSVPIARYPIGERVIAQQYARLLHVGHLEREAGGQERAGLEQRV